MILAIKIPSKEEENFRKIKNQDLYQKKFQTNSDVNIQKDTLA